MLGGNGAEEDKDFDFFDDLTDEEFVGKEVTIVDLDNEKHLNEETGWVTGVDTDRFVVDLDNTSSDGQQVVKIKRQNLALCVTSESTMLSSALNTLLAIAKSVSPIFTGLASKFDLEAHMHDQQRIMIIMQICSFRKYSGGQKLSVCCWSIIEKILPHAIKISGRYSRTVAGILMHVLNVYEELPLDKQVQHADRLIKCAEQMQAVVQNGPNINHGNTFDLPFWELDEAEVERGLDNLYLEAITANHMASAMQNKEDFKNAEAMYKHAISRAESANHMSLANGFYSNLATLHEHIALPATRPNRRGNGLLEKNPEVFNELQSHHLNEALRCALKHLRGTQKLYGTTHQITGVVHEMIAGFCYQARIRKPAVYHIERAKSIKTSIFGPDHNLTESVNQGFTLITNAYATEDPLVLDDDVKEGLSRSVGGTRCDHKGCSALESKEIRFKLCSRCRVPKYCCVKCQKSAWPDHKKQCVKGTVVQEERDEEYKLKQKRLGKLEKESQKKS
jgi:hypothetical protein